MYNQIYESTVTRKTKQNKTGKNLLVAQESRHRKQKFLRNYFLRLIIQQLFIAINQSGLLVTVEDTKLIR